MAAPLPGHHRGVADVQRSDDGHHLLIGGRRWRASDPELPEDVRRRLVDHLMDARRAVAAARRADDREAERRARARVHTAKTGLGERGTPWWEQPLPDRRTRWEEALRALDP